MIHGVGDSCCRADVGELANALDARLGLLGFGLLHFIERAI
jgi:hypothetical protein